MAITKTIEEDKIEIVSEFRHLQIRTATVIKEDGVELSRSFHRRVIHSGTINESLVWSDTDVSSESVEVQRIAEAVWVPTVKDAYKNFLISESNSRP